jgi:hypothetical protein
MNHAPRSSELEAFLAMLSRAGVPNLINEFNAEFDVDISPSQVEHRDRDGLYVTKGAITGTPWASAIFHFDRNGKLTKIDMKGD